MDLVLYNHMSPYRNMYLEVCTRSRWETYSTTDDTVSTTSLAMADTQLFDDLDKDPEIQTMRALEKHYVEGSQEKPRGFIQLFDWFRHEGPNGIHNCLVMELLGPSLETILRTNVEMEEFLAPDTILRTSRQLLEAIEFVHQAGLFMGV
ncbi:hypothetical protein VE02_04683 [Pseudogymnoascus sp. 03VT05]|nr:hypothetical protein VE02_04683 [Pseudogymnoascus sp. 03VT05]